MHRVFLPGMVLSNGRNVGTCPEIGMGRRGKAKNRVQTNGQKAIDCPSFPNNPPPVAPQKIQMIFSWLGDIGRNPLFS